MSRKKLVTLTTIIVLMIIGAGVGAWFWTQNIANVKDESNNNPKPAVTAKKVCDKDTLSKAAEAMKYPIDNTKLSQIVTDIKSNTDYRRDVNCLYVVAQYNVSAGNASEARSDLNALKGLYNSSAGYDTVLGADTQSPAMIETVVSSLENQLDDFVKPDDQILIPPDAASDE
jgi:hypothetical protein